VSRLARRGVRARVEASFAVSGLLVSAFLAGVSWNLTTTYLYNQRELTVTRTALISSAQLARSTPDGMPPSPAALQRAKAADSEALYLPADGARPAVSTPGVDPADVPRALVSLAADGTAAQQRIVVDDRTVLAVALPLPEDDGIYIELFDLDALDETLTTLSVVLFGTGALATVLASALGRWATGRTLRPLQSLVAAAAHVAQGDLDVRIDAAGDPDLEPLAAAFNDTTADLRARVARDARFTSDVSHELRSPLTTIVNGAELLGNRREELSPTGREALDLLGGEIQQFRGLVLDLLEVSREDQGTQLQREPTVLADLVRRAADQQAHRCVTHVTSDARDAVAQVEPVRVERIVSNLVANAELHGHGVREVCVELVGDAVRISVRDHGDGVPPEDRERVFERFFRGSASRAGAPGSGLGLAIVAQHVRAHGGRVWVEDAIPHGAAFVVELPLTQPNS
jgi:two-component system sensor histidine kinase MtrB